MSPGRRRAELLGRLLLLWAVGGTPLLVWLASYEMFEQPKQLALKLAAAGIAAAAATGPLRVPAAAVPPLLALLGVSLAGSIASPLPRTSFFGEYASYQGWLHWLAVAALVLAAARLAGRPRDGRRLLAAAAFSMTLVAAYALVQLAGIDPVPWSIEGPLRRTFSTAGNSLYLGILLAGGVPLTAAMAVTARTGGGRLVWLGACGAVLAGLLSSGSRGALGGAIAGAALLLRLLRRRPGLARRAWKAAAAVAVVAALAAVLLPGDRNPFPLLGERIAELARGRDSRPEIWRGAARLIRRAPLLGSGLDTFATLHSGVRTPRLWEYIWRGSPEKAHNEILQLAAGGGILGTGAAIWLLAVAARIARARLNDPRTATLAAAGAAGLLAIFLPSLFGFATCGPQAAAVALAALVLGGGRTVSCPAGAVRAVTIVLAVSALAHLRFGVSEVLLKSSLRSGRPEMETALAAPAPWAQRLMRAGFTLERRWFGATMDAAGGASGEPSRLALLERIYGRAAALDPLSSVAQGNLGRLALRGGRMEEALERYARAQELSPVDPYLAIEYAQALLAAGMAGEALVLLRNTTRDYPRFGEPYGLIGYIHVRLREPEQAVPVLERSLQLDWHGNSAAAAAAAGNLAALYHRAGRTRDAESVTLWARRLAAGEP